MTDDQDKCLMGLFSMQKTVQSQKYYFLQPRQNYEPRPSPPFKKFLFLYLSSAVTAASQQWILSLGFKAFVMGLQHCFNYIQFYSFSLLYSLYSLKICAFELKQKDRKAYGIIVNSDSMTVWFLLHPVAQSFQASVCITVWYLHMYLCTYGCTCL